MVFAVLSSTSAAAQDEEYINALSAQLDVATGFLDNASEAIGGCNSDFVRCLQKPEPYAQELDNASAGLSGVEVNLSAITPPARFASAHSLMIRGFQRVADGVGLYGAAIRERDLDKLDNASELIRAGRADISSATVSAFGQQGGQLDLILILIIATAATAASVGILLFIVTREGLQSRRTRMADEATCPKCGEVLDKWWTYRGGQIAAWRTAHLKSHAKDNAAQAVRMPPKEP